MRRVSWALKIISPKNFRLCLQTEKNTVIFTWKKLIEDEEKKNRFAKESRAHDRDFGLNDKIFGTNELQRAHRAC